MAKYSKFPPNKQEMYYYDKNDKVYKPVVENDGMLPIQSIQKKWKDSFTRPDLDKWNVVKNVGASVSTASGELIVDLGMTQDNEVILETKETFTDPFRALLSYMFTASVTGTEWHFEAVTVDDVTKEATGRGGVGWRFKLKDDHATYNYYASYYTQNGAFTPFYSSPVSLGSSLLWTTYNIAELELFADEVWYHHRLMDSASGRSYSQVRHQQLPDPNALYKIRIRGKNLAVPSAPVQFKSQFLTVVDYAELTAEITAGRGNMASGQGIFATVGGSLSTVSTITTGNVRNYGLWYTETTTNLGANATFLGSARTTGSTTAVNYSKIRVRVYSQTAGTLYIEQSRTSTTTDYRCPEGHSFQVSAGQCIQVEVDCLAYYARIKFVNGATAHSGTGAFEIISHLVGVS
jgi:hypothetical protein